MGRNMLVYHRPGPICIYLMFTHGFLLFEHCESKWKNVGEGQFSCYLYTSVTLLTMPPAALLGNAQLVHFHNPYPPPPKKKVQNWVIGIIRQLYLRFLCIKVRLICDKIGGTVRGGGGNGSSSNDHQLYLVFLVALHESLGARYVLGELVGVDHVLHVADPGDGVTVVGQEAVHLVRLHQSHLTLISLTRDNRSL